MRSSQARVRVARVSRDAGRTHRADTLAVEEPLEIRVNGAPLAVTMRTPVHDFSLAVGFALSEGIIHSADDVTSVRYCQKDQGPKGLNTPLPVGAFAGADTALDDTSDNVVDITLAAHEIGRASCRKARRRRGSPTADGRELG